MTEIFLGVLLLFVILSQFIRKSGDRQTKEVVVYDSRTIAGKLSSLGVRTQVSLLIGGVLLIAIAVFSYLSFHNYSEIKELIANEKYLEAESRIESGPSVLPLFDIDELEYDLRLKWASASIDAEEWEQAVNQIRELKKDSIPQDLIPSAFESYYEHINSHIPFKVKRYFDQKTGVGYHREGEVYTYLDYVKALNIDSSLINGAYELFGQLKSSNSIESRRMLIHTTNDYRYIKAYLESTDDLNFIAQEYVQDPVIINHILPQESQLSDYQMRIRWDSIENLEIQIIEHCLNKNLISPQILIRAEDLEMSAINLGGEGVLSESGKFKVEKSFLDILNNYSWSEEEDLDLQINFLVAYMWLTNFSSVSDLNADRASGILKDFFAKHPIEEMKRYKQNIEVFRNKIDFYMRKENQWVMSLTEFNDLEFDSFYNLRAICLKLADAFSEYKRGFDALEWYDLALNLNVLTPEHNSPFRPYWRSEIGLYNPYTSDYYYYRRAIEKWNLEPYGEKLGYCDDLKKAMELGSEEALPLYLKDCN